jgi:hypothetical protein
MEELDTDFALQETQNRVTRMYNKTLDHHLLNRGVPNFE